MITKPAILLPHAWPIADRNVWIAACKPHVRLKAGGRAGHMRASTRNGLASTYGQFLATCASNGQGTGTVTPCELVTPGNVAVFVDGLERRVSSVTVATIIYRLCRIACLLRPDVDWFWLCEIWLDRKDRMQRRSLSHRLVTGDRLYRLGVSLMQEADANERLNRRWRGRALPQWPPRGTPRHCPHPPRQLASAGNWQDPDPPGKRMVDCASSI